MTPEQIEALRAAAESATPGPREFYELRDSLRDGLGYLYDEYKRTIAHYGDNAFPPAQNRANGELAELLDRETILALLTERDALLRVAEAAERLNAAAMEAVDADPGAEDWDAVLDASAVYGVALAALPDAKGDADAA